MKKIVILLLLTLMVMTVSAVTETDVDVDVNSGSVDISTNNDEAGVQFNGQGGFVGNYHSTETGNYLDTNVFMESTTGASLGFLGHQELSGYTTNDVIFETFAYGNNALLNNRFDNSNYVVQLERVDTSRDFLSASDSSSYGIGWMMEIVDDSLYSSSGVSATLYGAGAGAMDTNQWHSTSIGIYGWGNPDGIVAPSRPGYYTPTNSVDASGEGLFTQSAYGDNNLEMNGFVFGSGTGTFTGSFSGGLSGNYYMWAN